MTPSLQAAIQFKGTDSFGSFSLKPVGDAVEFSKSGRHHPAPTRGKFGLAPVLNLQPRNDCVLRQRRGIEEPTVGNDLLKFQKIFLAQLAPPEFAQRLHPEKREPHFLFEVRFNRRRDFDFFFGNGAQSLVDVRNIWQIEKFEEAIDVATILRLVILCRHHAPAVAGGGGPGRC